MAITQLLDDDNQDKKKNKDKNSNKNNYNNEDYYDESYILPREELLRLREKYSKKNINQDNQQVDKEKLKFITLSNTISKLYALNIKFDFKYAKLKEDLNEIKDPFLVQYFKNIVDFYENFDKQKSELRDSILNKEQMFIFSTYITMLKNETNLAINFSDYEKN